MAELTALVRACTIKDRELYEARRTIANQEAEIQMWRACAVVLKERADTFSRRIKLLQEFVTKD